MALNRLVSLLIVLCSLIALPVSAQQSFMDEPGIPAFTTAFPIEHGFINLSNGNLHLEIPIASYPQRGDIKALHARLVYDSRIWTIRTDPVTGGRSWIPGGIPNIGVGVGGGFRLITDGEPGIADNDRGVATQCACITIGPGPCQPRFKITYSNYFYQEPNGTSHRLANTFKRINNNPSCPGAASTPDGTAYAVDGSGYKIVVTNYSNMTVYAPDGSQVFPVLQDTNGNFYSTTPGQTRNVVDTLGRTPVVTTGSGSQFFLDYLCAQGCNPGSGDRARITINGSAPAWATQFNQTIGGNIGEYSGAGSALQSIVFPDNTSYQFEQDSYGQITSMTLPTGGQITFGYTNFTDYQGHVNRWVTSMIKDGQTWSFTPVNQACSTPPCPMQVTVTTPAYNDGSTTAGDTHVYLFSVVNQGAASGSWNTQTQYFRGAASGNPVLTKNIDYGIPGSCPATPGIGGAVPEVIRETLTWPSGSGTLSKKAEYCYDSFANRTATKGWDYKPNGSFASTPDREIDNVYKTDPSYIDANLIRLLQTSTTLNSAGAQVAQTAYGYDEVAPQPSGITNHHANPAGPRGNLTSTARWLNTTNSPITSTQNWYDTGELFKSIDAKTNPTTFFYDSTGAYANKACNPKNQCSYAANDFNTGLLISSTDANGSQAGDPAHTTTNTYDSMLRPLCVNFPDGGQKCANYPAANQIAQQQKITGALTDTSTTILDSLGRVSQTQHSLPNGVAKTDTTYDQTGAVSTVSNPYFTTSDPTYGITQTFHDALGRAVKVIKQDGSVASSTFSVRSGNLNSTCAKKTDEAGNARIACQNGFGELTEVDEPNPASPPASATGWIAISGNEQTGTSNVTITVPNSGFETPVVGAGGFQYGPTGGSWSFVGGISGNGSGFTSGNPAAPEGVQVAFLQGAGLISQSLSGFQSGVSYTVSFKAAQRGNFNQGGQDFDVYLDNTFLATFRPASSSYATLTTPAFTTTTGSHTLKFQGRNSSGGDNTAFIDAVTITGTGTVNDTGTVTITVNSTPYTYNYGAVDTASTVAAGLTNAINAGSLVTAVSTANADVTVPNSGFETPVVGAGGFQYGPTGGSWSFVGGISGNGSGFTSGNPAAPEGVQVAFLQGAGLISQSLSGFQSGVSYTVSFKAAQRGNFNQGGQDFDVYLDNTFLATFRPASSSYATLTTPTFTTTTGSHTLKFQGRNSSGGDNTAFIDAVRVTAASGNVITVTSVGTGSATNYTLSTSSTHSGNFAQSFTASPSGATLMGGLDAGDLSNNPYVTLYRYDTLGNVYCVEQHGDAASGTGCPGTPPGATDTPVQPDPNNAWRRRLFAYDSLSRLRWTSNPESGTTSYQYDDNGNVITKTDARGITINYNPPESPIDSLNRVTKKTYSNGDPSVVLTYDVAPGNTPATLLNLVGRLSGSSVGNVSTVQSYDVIGRVASQWQCTPLNCGTGWLRQDYAYSLAGGLASHVFDNGFTITQTYDSAGRISQVTSTISDAQHPGTLATFDSSLGFYPSGNLRKMTLGNGLTETAAYNNRLQPCRTNLNSSGSALGQCSDALPPGNVQDFKYGFNAGASDNGNLTSFAATGFQTFNRTYSYDPLNRLSIMSAPGDACSGLSWQYDAWANRTNQIVTGGTCNPFQAPGTAQNRLLGPYQYDAAGNMTNDGTHSYTYDAEDQATKVDAGNTATYLYNAAGQRVQKITPTSQTNYFLDLDGNAAVEKDQNGVLLTDYIYVHGSLLAQYKAGTTFFFTRDHLGSTRLMSAIGGTVSDSLDYLPYGEQIAGGTGTTRKFTGKERDAESGLDYFGARFDSSSLGRFMSPDRGAMHMENPQSLNRYSYTLNNPLLYVDPNGKDPLPTNIVVSLANFYQQRDQFMRQWAYDFRDHRTFPPRATSKLKEDIRQNAGSMTSEASYRSIDYYKYQDAVEDYMFNDIVEKVTQWLNDPKTTKEDLEAALVTLSGEEHLADVPWALAWIPYIDRVDQAGKAMGAGGIRNNLISILEKMIEDAKKAKEKKEEEERKKKKQHEEECKKDKTKC